jgi:hypothetical protein
MLELVLAALLAPPPSAARPLREDTFTLDAPAEVVARLAASCAGCSWDAPGREAAALRLEVDGRYSQHLLLTRGEALADYRVALGRLGAGTHRLSVSLDRHASARAIGSAQVEQVAWEPAPLEPLARLALAHAPILYARPRARFSDVPLVMWYEAEPGPGGGVRLRYSVVFSNEDGGTPPDRLLATWGRLTDIEYVYGVELDGEGQASSSEYQGRDHVLRPFRGEREGTRPRLFVATENNMLSHRGSSTVRFAPAPVPFDLAGVSREEVMDAHPWTYRVSAQEVRREGRVSASARPGSGRIVDPRRYAILEACAPAEDATLAFALEVAGRDGRTRWVESDAGGPRFRVSREPHNFPNGCFRAAVALPAGTGAGDLVSLAVRAYTRPAREGEPALPKGAGRARLLRVNRLFLMERDDRPGPLLFRWEGDEPLRPEGPPFVVPLRPPAPPAGASSMNTGLETAKGAPAAESTSSRR